VHVSKKQIIYIVSDSVGETAELMVKAVATQFNEEDVEIQNISYVENIEDLKNIISIVK
jgi:[pyruvate, water dikinase]-phosphate phosphotransferase / [pyruvate, water dikinase] kinase